MSDALQAMTTSLLGTKVSVLNVNIAIIIQKTANNTEYTYLYHIVFEGGFVYIGHA